MHMSFGSNNMRPVPLVEDEKKISGKEDSVVLRRIRIQTGLSNIRQNRHSMALLCNSTHEPFYPPPLDVDNSTSDIDTDTSVDSAMYTSTGSCSLRKLAAGSTPAMVALRKANRTTSQQLHDPTSTFQYPLQLAGTKVCVKDVTNCLRQMRESTNQIRQNRRKLVATNSTRTIGFEVGSMTHGLKSTNGAFQLGGTGSWSHSSASASASTSNSNSAASTTQRQTTKELKTHEQIFVDKRHNAQIQSNRRNLSQSPSECITMRSGIRHCEHNVTSDKLDKCNRNDYFNRIRQLENMVERGIFSHAADEQNDGTPQQSRHARHNELRNQQPQGRRTRPVSAIDSGKQPIWLTSSQLSNNSVFQQNDVLGNPTKYEHNTSHTKLSQNQNIEVGSDEENSCRGLLNNSTQNPQLDRRSFVNTMIGEDNIGQLLHMPDPNFTSSSNTAQQTSQQNAYSNMSSREYNKNAYLMQNSLSRARGGGSCQEHSNPRAVGAKHMTDEILLTKSCFEETKSSEPNRNAQLYKQNQPSAFTSVRRERAPQPPTRTTSLYQEQAPSNLNEYFSNDLKLSSIADGSVHQQDWKIGIPLCRNESDVRLRQVGSGLAQGQEPLRRQQINLNRRSCFVQASSFTPDWQQKDYTRISRMPKLDADKCSNKSCSEAAVMTKSYTDRENNGRCRGDNSVCF